MDEVLVSQTPDIKSLILTVRDTQVLLDSDVAMLYGYETRRVNETANRNRKRFPSDFRFQLTKEEADGIEAARFRFDASTGAGNDGTVLMSQSATSRQHGGRRKLPYVYSEQGIASLSGLLKSDTAIQVSIGIMRAFVEMRRFIAAYGKTFERLTSVEYKLLEHDRKFDELFDLIQLPGLPQQGILFKGQIYDAFKLLVELIRTAKVSIAIIDNYADDTVLDMLSERKRGVSVHVITRSPDRISRLRLSKFNEQYPFVSVVKSDEFHDRFIIVDDSTVYHLGASLKDAGGRCFAISLLEDTAALLAKIRDIVSRQ